MRNLFKLILVILTFCLFFNGCGRTGPSRFYILSTISNIDSQPLKSGMGIGVGPVDIPDYLERPQIVTRTRQNKIKLADFDKWAGSLKHDIPRVLAENLSVLLNTDHVFVYPWKGTMPLKYQVKVDIIQFDAEPEKNAVLIARWTILDKNGRKVLKMKKADISIPINNKDYESIVFAESQALAKISLDIAQTLKTIK